MDLKKQKSFNERMGKRQNLSRGGLIKRIGNRKYFDAGGGVGSNTVSNPNATSKGTNDLAHPTGGYNPLGDAYGAVGGPLQTGLGGAGGMAQGIAADFTTQNQYQAALAPTVQYNYGPAIGAGQENAINGYNQFNQNLATEQALNAQLGNIAAGQGPNPAQAMLNTATGQNVNNQAALMAGQRGAGANVGLIARQNALQGAGVQQTSAGQGAQLQAQQSLGALGQQAGLQGAMGNQITAQQNANTGLLGTGASANNAQNNTNVSNYGMAQAINSQVAQNNANAVNATESGLLGGAASVLGFDEGGEVKQSGNGGGINISEPEAPPVNVSNFSSKPEAPEKKSSGLGSMMSFLSKGGNICNGPHRSHVANFLAMGGKSHHVPAMVSAGEVYLSPDQVKKVIHEGADPLKIGEKFKGKAKVKGDSLKNDNIPRTLEEGGVVIPRHVSKMKGPGRSEKAELFVRRAVHMHSPKGGK